MIDPTLIYLGTLASGIAQTNVSQITVDSTGALYFVGTTNETAFPTTPGAYQTVCGPSDATAAANNVTYCNGNNYTSAFITKLSPDGTKLVYSTFLSGHGGLETGTSIAVDAAGVAYLLGATASNDFPITSDAFQTLCGPGQSPGFRPAPVTPTSQCNNFHNGGGTEYTINGPEAYFAKLSATGSSLLYASFLGGSLPVYPVATALDASGNWYIFVQTALRPASDLYGTGGGNVQYPGLTASGYQNVAPAGTYVDNGAALSKFSNDGRTLLYGTYFGDVTRNVPVQPQSFAVGANGIAFLGGYSNAVNLPTTGGVIKQSCSRPNADGTCQNSDGFVAAMDTTKAGAASLVWASRLGGSGIQGSNIPLTQVLGLLADSGNDVFATGYTSDHTFPIGSGGYQATCPNYDPTDSTDRCDSAYLIKINPTGTAVLNGSFLNDPRVRSPESVGYSIRLDSKGQVYLYGRSNDGAGNFPTVNPLQGYQGGNKLFIATFSADLSKLLFSTRFGNPANNNSNVSPAGGLALDPSDSIYFAGTTTDTVFPGTTGTYNTATTTGQGNHPFFAKLSKMVAATSTTLTVPAGSTGVGQALTLIAKVAGATQTTSVPTGSVTFTYTSSPTPTVAGTAPLDATGTATLNITAPTTAGTYTVTAMYGGDGNYDISTSSPGSVAVVFLPAPTVTLTLPTPTLKVGATATFNVTVVSPAGNSAKPSGTILFKDGATTLGSSPLSSGAATYSTASLLVGAHAITATYSGDSNFAGITTAAQTETVQPYTPTISVQAAPTTFQINQTSTFTATVSSAAGGPAITGTVNFLVDNIKVNTATLSNGSATFATNLAVGPHSLTAVYSGDANNASVTSAAVALTVTQPTAAISLTSAQANPGNSVATLTATVTTATGTGTPTGSVTFVQNQLAFSTVNLVNGTAVYFGGFAAGASSVTAVYNGDTNFAAVTSAPVSITVRPITPTTSTLTASVTSQLQGQPIGFTAQVVATGTAAAGGTYTFYDGTTSLGTAIISNSVAFLSVRSLTPGTHLVSAVYSGDQFDLSSTTPALTIIITTQDVAVIATPDPLVIKAGHSATQTLQVAALNGFIGSVSLSCPSNPQYVACVFSPATLNFNPGTSLVETTILTVYTDAAHTASVRQPASFFQRNYASLALLFWLPGSALALVGLRRKSSLTRPCKSLLTLVFLVAALGSTLALSGCGGNNNNFASAQPGSYTFPITVTASDGTTQTLTTNITIQ